MEDFNHIEHDPIPEGLEFNESYMHDAFALYDAEKEKRKRRILIWWLTSAVGFASALLVGIFFLTKGEGVPDPGKEKAVSQKQELAHQLPGKQLKRTSAQTTPGKKTAAAGAVKYKPEIGQVPSVKSTSADLSTVKTEPHSHQAGKNTRLRFGGKQRRNEIPGTGKHTGYPGTGEQVTGTAAGPGSAVDIVTENGQQASGDSRSFFDPVNVPAKGITFADSAPVLPGYVHIPARETEIPPRKHQLFMNLGVNTLFGMKELQHRATFRESIGLSYSYRIHPKITIGAGLQYHSISRISYKRIIGDTLKSDKTTTTLNKTTLNYISFLPRVSYSVGSKHQITAGFGIEYLLVDPGERYQIQNYTKEEPRRTNSKLYYSTFNRLNFSASAGYSYQFSPFMSAEAAYHFGFTDITINNGFNSTFDRNSRLYLGLKIKLR